MISFAFAPENSGIISIRPLRESGEDMMMSERVYLESTRRRDGEGAVAVAVKFSGWEVDWRGVNMEVYIANVSFLFRWSKFVVRCHWHV
jgi:hypothetical protein